MKTILLLCFKFDLACEVSKSLVGLGHAVDIIALLDSGSLAAEGSHQLFGQFLAHRLASAGSGSGDDPTISQDEAAFAADLVRNLVVGAADALAANFQERSDVLQRLVEDVARILLGLVLDDVESGIDHSLSDGLLAVLHDIVDKLGYVDIVIANVAFDLAFWCWFSSHIFLITRLFSGRLGFLSAVAGAGLFAVGNTLGIINAAHDLVADTWKILSLAAFDQNDRMLLQIVAHARDIASDLHAVRQADASDLTQGRVRLFRGSGGNFQANAALESGTGRQNSALAVQSVEGSLQGWTLTLGFGLDTPFAN